jgi:hypothetical protein
MYFLVQTFFSVNKEIRRLWSNLFVFKVSKNEMANIFDELVEHPIEYMRDIMKIIYDKPYQYMFLNTDSQRIFKGFDELIIDEEDD